MDAACRYCRIIKRNVQCEKTRRDAFVEKISADIAAYTREAPDADMQALVENFGEPKEVAQEFLQTLDPVFVLEYQLRQKNRLCIVLGALLAIMVGLFVAFYFYRRSVEKFQMQVVTVYISDGPEESWPGDSLYESEEEQ